MNPKPYVIDGASLNLQQTESPPLPSLAWVALTNRCNLSCSHCQRGVLRKQGLLALREMSVKLFEKLERELFPYLKRIQFGGNNFGEQLSASHWDEFFARVSKLKMDISIVSNATLLNSERIKAMVDAGVEFNFSLEGITGESYAAVRGYKFEKFLGSLSETCQEKLRTVGTGAKVNLGFTAMSDNIKEIPQLLRTATQLGVDRVTVTHFVPWEESQRQKSLVYHKELANQMFRKADELARELNLLVDLPMPFRTDEGREPGSQSEDKSSVAFAPCYHPWNSVSINEKGDVMPCCATSIVMGNLEKSSFPEIWNNGKYRKLRKTVNSDAPLLFCRYCGLRGIEVGSSKALSFCSDEDLLLAAIGHRGHRKSSRSVLRTFKNRLLKTRFGGKLVPYAVDLYREHGAFYVMDILENWLTPLARRLSKHHSDK